MSFTFATKLAFSVMDVTDSKKLSLEEVTSKILPLVGNSDMATTDCMEFFFQLCDLDNDGFLSYEEFNHFMFCYDKCCDKGFVKIKADLIVVLFIEIFRAIDSDMNGTVCCSEVTHSISKLEYSNTTMFGYKDMFVDIKNYCTTKGPNTELTEFEFLCISIKPEILFMHLEAKYKTLFKKIDKEKRGFIDAKEMQGHIVELLFPRGCETKNAIDFLVSILVSSTKSQKVRVNQFGFIVELLKDVSSGSTFLTNPMLYEAMFRLIDNNSNGELDGDELLLLMNTVKLPSQKKSIVMDAFKTKHTITYTQFIDFF
ncbi:hypothetical protein EIN_061180 [Entamoeba invadens IP1]|uniref:EF-hand domain-containing protein n=1 Tax=Entamoeba invadens TaxID=33085 RepID=S0B354_ENTIV|nr:hypothetical protein EIN_061180 [Entamoeba invadens IP1]ELP93553.1 hypothetical protein EIN_061180 [Entamoeba invadens IP1]BAN42225.1 hypothetical protein [Entamoeba invadens]|eukprot:XP_004260324.1 hypothetical protein EIN_061180 [Entamoeba invadens IP1]